MNYVQPFVNFFGSSTFSDALNEFRKIPSSDDRLKEIGDIIIDLLYKSFTNGKHVNGEFRSICFVAMEKKIELVEQIVKDNKRPLNFDQTFLVLLYFYRNILTPKKFLSFGGVFKKIIKSANYIAEKAQFPSLEFAFFKMRESYLKIEEKFGDIDEDFEELDEDQDLLSESDIECIELCIDQINKISDETNTNFDFNEAFDDIMGFIKEMKQKIASTIKKYRIILECKVLRDGIKVIYKLIKGKNGISSKIEVLVKRFIDIPPLDEGGEESQKLLDALKTEVMNEIIQIGKSYSDITTMCYLELLSYLSNNQDDSFKEDQKNIKIIKFSNALKSPKEFISKPGKREKKIKFFDISNKIGKIHSFLESPKSQESILSQRLSVAISRFRYLFICNMIKKLKDEANANEVNESITKFDEFNSYIQKLPNKSPFTKFRILNENDDQDKEIINGFKHFKFKHVNLNDFKISELFYIAEQRIDEVLNGPSEDQPYSPKKSVVKCKNCGSTSFLFQKIGNCIWCGHNPKL